MFEPNKRLIIFVFACVCVISIPVSGAVKTIDHDWEKDSTVYPETRISSDDSVTVAVTNFNFLQFTVKFTVEEETLEAYQYLEQLWKQILGIGVFAPGTFSSDHRVANAKATLGVLEEIYRFQVNMYDLDTQIDEERNRYTTVALGMTEVQTIVSNRRTLETRFNDLVTQRKKIIDLLRPTELDRRLSSDLGKDVNLLRADPSKLPADATMLAALNKALEDGLAAFKAADAIFKELRPKAESYLTAARLVQDGLTKVIGKKKSGTRVTVTMIAVDSNEVEKGDPHQAVYFVHSDLPVIFHAGYALSDLTDFKFERLQVDGNDLFQMTSDEENTNDVVAYLSMGHPSLTFKDGDVSILGTIGTSVMSPGDTLYFGGSFRFKRFFVTVGRSTKKTQTGENMVDPETMPQLKALFAGRGPANVEVPNLFTTLREDREWATFFSISFSIF